MRKTAHLFLFVAALFLCGCEGAKQDLLVHCGGGLRLPVSELIEQFEAENGVHIAANYDGSERLIGAIQVSRRGDLFIPGDKHYVDLLEKQELITDRASMCYFVPTILVAKNNPHGIQSLKDLLKPGIKLGLGDERACAIGRKCKKIFEKNGVAWTQVVAKLSFNAGKVDELGQHIEVGSLDAAIVWDATAEQFSKAGDAISIPLENNVISTVDAGVLRCTKNRDLAVKFLAFMAAPNSKRVFKKHGFRVDPPQ